jgi:hypothetical protein
MLQKAPGMFPSPRTSILSSRRVALALTALAACTPLDPETALADDELASAQGAVVLNCGECDWSL